MGNVLQDATSQMEKDKYSQEMIELIAILDFQT
jgi:hypothetical protein